MRWKLQEKRLQHILKACLNNEHAGIILESGYSHSHHRVAQYIPDRAQGVLRVEGL